MEKILITGVSGFIGFHLVKLLLNNDYEVVGIYNMNNYYDIRLKEKRLEILKKYDNYTFYKIDLKYKKDIDNIFKNIGLIM